MMLFAHVKQPLTVILKFEVLLLFLINIQNLCTQFNVHKVLIDYYFLMCT